MDLFSLARLPIQVARGPFRNISYCQVRARCSLQMRTLIHGPTMARLLTVVFLLKANGVPCSGTKVRTAERSLSCIDFDDKCRIHDVRDCPIDWVLFNNDNVCKILKPHTCCVEYNKAFLKDRGIKRDKTQRRRKRRNIPSIESMPNVETRFKRRAVMGKGDGRMRAC